MLSRQLWVSFSEASSCLSKNYDAHLEDPSLMSRAHSAVMQCCPRMPKWHVHSKKCRQCKADLPDCLCRAECKSAVATASALTEALHALSSPDVGKSFGASCGA